MRAASLTPGETNVRGLYDPNFERDACGVGFIADLAGKPSHATIEQGLEILENLTHRGASGADASTGDGAGILMQMPHAFLRRAAAEIDITLPAPGEYGVGMHFLARDPVRRRRVEIAVESALTGRGHRVLGWRDVPVVEDALGETARAKAPVVRQLFVQRGAHIPDAQTFNRELYIARKTWVDFAIRSGLRIPDDLYTCSLSTDTLIYKGLLLASQIAEYYPDLRDRRMASSLALVHQRFSTNTFPEWHLAQPFRFVAHNGEINTLQGNVNWMRARESRLKSKLLGDTALRIRPIILPGASDSASFDNVLELLTMAGRSVPHAMMMMIPEAWERDHRMGDELKAFYAYHAGLLEPWDGPAAMVFTDGRRIGATLDRNGLRPLRWIQTDDDRVILASETGVLDIPDAHIVRKGRLQPGRLLLVDLKEQRVIEDAEVKKAIAANRPYRAWLNKHRLALADLPPVAPEDVPALGPGALRITQKTFGYSNEDLRVIIEPMARDAKEPIGSMGTDTPLAVLSDRQHLLYDYFKQHFAQVSNPPIDSTREELVMSLACSLGADGNLLSEKPEQARALMLPGPVLTTEDLARVRTQAPEFFVSETLQMLWRPAYGLSALEAALETLVRLAEGAVRLGKVVLVLSDRATDKEYAPIPALLAVGAVHHHLIRAGLRSRCSLIVESGEPREVMHIALLVGYGAHAVNPWLALDTVREIAGSGELGDLSPDDAVRRYIKALDKGILKTISKMGISTLQSYHGAQVFEAVGLHQDLVDRFFAGTPSRIGGIRADVVAEESRRRHSEAYPERIAAEPALDWGGQYSFRAQGERHLWTPIAVAELQRAVREGDAEAYGRFAAEINDAAERALTIRGLLGFRKSGESVPIDEVEPVDAIVRRFKTGAMSLGSISAEAHETLAIAMNRLGGRSNTGEGGEDERRFLPDANGDLRRSAIKQVASGRFGVTAAYLANADELQIKMAQGAKPGEGGQLPGHKVSAEIAAVRHSTPGVGLISPPPHHDIYSIEDLAQLIFDLKNSNPKARVNVKLVAEIGVGTIAAGVAKAHADVVLISGHDGGTGASPLSSIKHAGVPWEIGLAEAQQVLVENGLRSRVVVETDGQLKTGRDVVVAAMLGAEEYGFSTAPLISMGCILLRKCHLNTCSVGIATQRRELRDRFAGTAENVTRYFRFVAQEVRVLLADLGFRSIDELVGRTDVLRVRSSVDAWKTGGLDLSALLERSADALPSEVRCTIAQEDDLKEVLDRELIKASEVALSDRKPVRIERRIRNRDRTVGAMLSYEVVRRYGSAGLDPETIRVDFSGSAGQSYGAFLARGLRFDLIGDANDGVGKGLSGGELSIRPAPDAAFVPEEASAIGNVALYGATSGRLFVRGRAGERFAVRNSGAQAVVEGVGDHGCEYMTGGRVVVLGSSGRNFAAGMSGGIAYVLQPRELFESLCNLEMVSLGPLDPGIEADAVRALIAEHAARTDSSVARALLEDWETARARFVRVMPREYARALAEVGTMPGAEPGAELETEEENDG